MSPAAVFFLTNLILVWSFVRRDYQDTMVSDGEEWTDCPGERPTTARDFQLLKKEECMDSEMITGFKSKKTGLFSRNLMFQ